MVQVGGIARNLVGSRATPAGGDIDDAAMNVALIVVNVTGEHDVGEVEPLLTLLKQRGEALVNRAQRVTAAPASARWNASWQGGVAR